MTRRFLINDDGSPFKESELQSLRVMLDHLNDPSRIHYRNQNASEIAKHHAERFLIVSGPGTGKSHLFLDRIDYWYQQDPDAKVVVTSFVRKLVADLQTDIDADNKLTDEQKSKITVSTLHKYARSIVEKNHGTKEWPFKSHFRIIGQSWKEVIWRDVLAFYPRIAPNAYTWKTFEKQLHDNDYDESEQWKKLTLIYFRLCQFYNAAGFADLILRAAKALEQNPDLNQNDHFIIDEYQDFNLSEESLINQLLDKPKGLLVVGDDEQVLYQKLKSGKPTLIRKLYTNIDYANGMLPFCSRSSYHIIKSADHFIQQLREPDCIEKIYLPLRRIRDDPKVQVVACATPSTAVDYIEKFVDDHKHEINERKRQLESGEKKDAFLLILTPARKVNFYGRSRDKITNIIANYRAEIRSFSDDYYKLLSYYSLANYPRNNFTFRKVLHYEGISLDKVHALVESAMQTKKDFCDLNDEEIANVIDKSHKIRNILDAEISASEKINQISKLISITDNTDLLNDIERASINQEEVTRLEHEEDEDAESEEVEVKRMDAVELMTIVGSKGLSSDHVIIIGFDNVNMSRVSKNAFYVSLTRARRSLHILTALKSGGATGVHSFFDKLPSEHIEYSKYTKSKREKVPVPNAYSFKQYLSNLSSFSAKRP